VDHRTCQELAHTAPLGNRAIQNTYIKILSKRIPKNTAAPFCARPPVIDPYRVSTVMLDPVLISSSCRCTRAMVKGVSNTDNELT
jgi:hypothetical protein